MLKEIYKALKDYPDFNAQEFENYRGTQTAWIKGQLTMGEWLNPKKPEDKTVLFEVLPQPEKRPNYSLIVQPENFSSGIGALLTSNDVLRANIGLPIEALVRVLYRNDMIKSFVAYPI